MNLLCRTGLSCILALSVVVQGFPQLQPAVKPELQIIILGGEGSINNIKQRTAREPIV